MWSCFVIEQDGELPSSDWEVMNGLTLVAPPRPFEVNPMPRIKTVGADWIAVVPYGFTPMGDPEVHFNSSRQWWGERPKGIRETIKLAKAAGLRVMLKPQVWSHSWWTGDYHFETSTEWERWEQSYTDYILHFATMADSLDVELFCVGTEFKNSVKLRPQYWSSLIKRVRNIYSGPLTYAANWDNYQQIPFWYHLDIVGINAYFPLLQEKTPSVQAICKAWKPHIKEIRDFYGKVSKPIAFTEYGYLSVDGCTYNTWELEANINQLAINEEAQANALNALHQMWRKEKYWIGGFLWKWFPNMRGHEGYPDKDYTPQGKMGEKTLAKWHGVVTP